MTYDLNNKKLKAINPKKIYLLDSSAYIRYEELYSMSGINLFSILEKITDIEILMTNDVLVELMNGPRVLSAKFMLDHIINSEGSMDHSLKENRFLFESEGKLSYLTQNMISATDWGQIFLCQNHPELTLVTNDRKQFKSARAVINDRVVGAFSFLELLIDVYRDNMDLKELRKKALELFDFNNAGEKSK